MTHTNDLIHESSPYLLQHAHNPVDWKPYNQETLKVAKERRKLMVISIGYAACHWCHVMEHESFEDEEVAEIMNKDYISVKVDREERPDVDHIYMNALQLMTGHGGWPLNVVTLPDGRPVWGGTYFRRKDWINALEQLQELYTAAPEKLIAYANRLEEGIKNMDLIHLNTEDTDLKEYPTAAIVRKMAHGFDLENGGATGAPKFMMPNILQFLLRYAASENKQDILDYITLTLNKMAYGGLYDQIGGGFARYSTDVKWHVPHFEKMLYDNAQLVSLYSQAYALTKSPLYKEVVEETLAFVTRELTDKSGGFYSSLDADSENSQGKLEEGAFYVYALEELDSLEIDDFNLFKDYYNINSYGHWEEGKYVLIRNKSDAQILRQYKLSPEDFRVKKRQWKKKLSDYRQQRPAPRLDDKTLTSWNAMMLTGFVDAYKVFGRKEYLQLATRNAEFLIKHQVQEDGRLLRNYKNGKSSINGFLEDYAFTISAFIDLYQATMDETWLKTTKLLTDYTLAHFFDAEKQMFYFTSSIDPVVVSRNFEYRDNVIPASNSVMAINLFRQSKYFEFPDYETIAQQMLRNMLPEIPEYPQGFTNWLDLLLNYQQPFYEVVVIGKDAEEKLGQINKSFLPNIILAGSTDKNDRPLFKDRYSTDKTLIYICVNNTCQLPETDIEEAILKLKKR